MGTRSLVQPELIKPTKRSYWIIGHRGFPEIAPENTLSSFIAAIEAGVDMLEFDVTLTKDGVPVVFHDRFLHRTTNGKGKVKSKTCEELKKLDAGTWFSSKFKGEQIPTLDEVLDLAACKVAVNIEIKMEAVSKNISKGIEEKILESVANRSMGKNSVISSFLPLAVQRIKKLNPHQSTALLLARPFRGNPLKVVERVGADALHLPLKLLKKEKIDLARMSYIPIRVYTVNKPTDMRKLIEWGVGGFFTDRVSTALDLTGTNSNFG